MNSLVSCFASAESFNQPLNNWKTSNVTDMSYMFYAAKTFNNDLSGWDVTKVEKYDDFAGDLGSNSQWKDEWKPHFNKN
nr:BspA family leucine-rich repeat surface protein [Williamsoniiplasma luminosum]